LAVPYGVAQIISWEKTFFMTMAVKKSSRKNAKKNGENGYLFLVHGP
jgi:hypothetical protein